MTTAAKITTVDILDGTWLTVANSYLCSTKIKTGCGRDNGKAYCELTRNIVLAKLFIIMNITTYATFIDSHCRPGDVQVKEEAVNCTIAYCHVIFIQKSTTPKRNLDSSRTIDKRW